MKCPSCERNLRIASSKFVSEINSTDVYAEQTTVCLNPKCMNYAGEDLDKPERVVQTTRNKVN